MEKRFGRDLRYSFYDVTNYYTEKEFADPDEAYHDRSGNLVNGPALGQKGVSYEERLDRKSGKMAPGLSFSSEDQVALDYRRIQETFGTNFYYAYAKQEDFKRFFKEIELGKDVT
ncbi:MAG: hypothetical protein Q4C66_15525 [Lachnospiraceae bacterium]|nr:hypothetical protein [Lachnospiraceae bacterium]